MAGGDGHAYALNVERVIVLDERKVAEELRKYYEEVQPQCKELKEVIETY